MWPWHVSIPCLLFWVFIRQIFHDSELSVCCEDSPPILRFPPGPSQKRFCKKPYRLGILRTRHNLVRKVFLNDSWLIYDHNISKPLYHHILFSEFYIIVIEKITFIPTQLIVLTYSFFLSLHFLSRKWIPPKLTVILWKLILKRRLLSVGNFRTHLYLLDVHLYKYYNIEKFIVILKILQFRKLILYGRGEGFLYWWYLIGQLEFSFRWMNFHFTSKECEWSFWRSLY